MTDEQVNKICQAIDRVTVVISFSVFIVIVGVLSK